MRFPALLATLLAIFVAPAALAAPVQTGHIEAELVAQDASVAPGSTVYVALRQKIQKDWHTYWRNGGDSGAATTLTWTLPTGFKAGDPVWPTPKRLVEGEPPNALAVYAYEGQALTPVPIEVPADARPGSVAHLQLKADFLVCAEQCVPETANLTLDIPVAAGTPAPDAKWGAAVAKALADAPKAAGLEGRFAVSGKTLTLSIAGPPLAGADLGGALFFPYAGNVLDHRADPVLDHGPQGLTLGLPAGAAFTLGKPPGEIAGILVLNGAAYEVTATPGPVVDGTTGLGAPAVKPKLGLGLAILYAFLGGLLLNLMPCVFPVLGMKAASLAGHGEERAAARAQGLAFLGGVVVTFLALAGLLLVLRAGGQAVGWGFQLQSPAVVAALSLLVLMAGLNLSGVYEIGTSVQGLGSGLASRGGLIGAFFTGVLAVVVAAPCTAPIMGPAIGLALTLSPPAALAIFTGLALGFATPFTLLAFTPALMRRLPKPGPWMDVFRHVLAFPMYGAAAWLAWVLSQQTNPVGLALLFAAALLAAFGAWLWGLMQARGGLVWRGLAALAVLGAFALALAWPYVPRAKETAGPAPAGKVELESQAWSAEKVEALRREHRPVLVNFTAAWCVTCQVNDATALATKGVAEALKRDNAVYLVGDWTNRDAAIAGVLSQFGRAGVPLYLVYDGNGGPPKVLPQLLTEGMVVKALDRARFDPVLTAGEAVKPPAAAAK